MLHYLFEYLDKKQNISGTGVFQYITFRSAFLFILVVVYDLWKELSGFCKISKWEKRRELGLQQNEKRVRQPWRLNYIRYLVPVVLFAKLQNIYVVLLINYCGWEQ
jgi:phospho-N-acetylmuramoyl-pentapeptide-transferase